MGDALDLGVEVSDRLKGRGGDSAAEAAEAFAEGGRGDVACGGGEYFPDFHGPPSSGANLARRRERSKAEQGGKATSGVGSSENARRSPKRDTIQGKEGTL